VVRAENRMKIWQYGSYAEYVAAQTEANKRKIHNVWVRSETIELITQYVISPVARILCHGTRNGAEQRMFKKHFPRAEVLGTEISETAFQFEFTIQHDFHVPNPTWVGAHNIVYSNSLDHAYAPRTALETWREQLHPLGGRLFIEHSFHESNNVSTASDPLEIDMTELLDLFGELRLKLIDIFDARGVKGADNCASKVFVLERA
jgi:hypothetical protein